jgi:hypothetical protein
MLDYLSDISSWLSLALSKAVHQGNGSCDGILNIIGINKAYDL